MAVSNVAAAEQDEMFPKVKKAKVDTAELGAQIVLRKHELQKTGGASTPRKNARA